MKPRSLFTVHRSLLLLLLCTLCVLCGLLSSPARADLRDYAPTVVTVQATTTTLLAADNQLQVVSITNTGAAAVWVCHAGQTAVVGRGFYLPVGGTLTFWGGCVPQQGLNAISASGTCTVAIGRG